MASPPYPTYRSFKKRTERTSEFRRPTASSLMAQFSSAAGSASEAPLPTPGLPESQAPRKRKKRNFFTS
ncbi:hypothetical protein Esi_0874_0003 [Ectocarpus siliculosus]|uniref:Uncharacterized protein n=1 Tax=Ectocarpus siliculosus TaxID=2880 RepID=D7G886_ECTSI|nr:hypothetical protein Esi_0874_0003 [Ectocarpus siliculosus]|eukprot:CBJ34023.1 hypothetical protein Esi_0874_0003 [Ectocarpus siliculosus]